MNKVQIKKYVFGVIIFCIIFGVYAFINSPENELHVYDDIHEIALKYKPFDILRFDGSHKRLELKNGKTLYDNELPTEYNEIITLNLGKYDSIAFLGMYPNPINVKEMNPILYEPYQKYYSSKIENWNELFEFAAGQYIITYALFKNGKVRFYSHSKGKNNIFIEFPYGKIFKNNTQYKISIIKIKQKNVVSTEVILIE